MARILIVEDQKIMQKYFEFIILQDPDLKLVDTISDAREAVKICNYSVIDLVLMDVQTFHNHDGLSAGKTIRKEHPGTKVLIVTSLIDPKVLERAKTGCADSLWYKVGDIENLPFPRIIPDYLIKGIKLVQYQIELSTLSTFAVDSKSAKDSLSKGLEK